MIIIKRWIISVGLIACVLIFFCFPVHAQKLASSINAYMAVTPDNNKVLADFIKKKLGVSVNQQYMSCGEIQSRMMAEAPRFSADMVIHACGPQAFLAKKKGWTIPYDSPTWRGANEIWKDPDNHWFNHGTLSFFLVGSKKRLAEKGYTMPESWDDLLDPKWKGEIVTSSPLTSGAAFRILFSFMTLYGFNKGKGEAGGWEYLEKLDKNIHHYTRSGNAPSELSAKGEFMLGIAYSVGALDRAKKGYPIYVTVPREGTGYGPAPSFILKGTKKAETTKRIIDLLGSPEGCKLMAELGGYETKDPVATPNIAKELFGGRIKYIPNLDIEWAYENKKRLIKEWKERILTK